MRATYVAPLTHGEHLSADGRVGQSHASAAITRGHCSTVIAEWIEMATMISTRNVGMVSHIHHATDECIDHPP
jgi:hypothetical protein